MRVLQSNELDGGSYSQGTGDEEAGAVSEILQDVRRNGDEAVRRWTRRCDAVETAQLRVEPGALGVALASTDASLREALEHACVNIRAFAECQRRSLGEFDTEVEPGVRCAQRIIPIRRVGVYVPGGRYPLVSSLLMGVIPARVAGVCSIAVCSPPSDHGEVPQALLAAAAIAGVEEVYRVGGAQAIAAFAYGTESVARVDKIVGPGNRFVTAAKRLVAGDVGIDLPAGPSEVMIVADDAADPALVAADILAQAEHDREASAMLVTDSPSLAARVLAEIDRQCEGLPTADIARCALDGHGWIVIVRSLEEAVEIADRRGPEHLELQLRDAERWALRFRSYGSLFIGQECAEAFGDYNSGLNHTLPTRGAARYTGGLGVKDFLKVVTTLSLTPEGVQRLGPHALVLAESEGLAAHAASIRMRLGDWRCGTARVTDGDPSAAAASSLLSSA